MTVDEMKKRVLSANLQLPKLGLVMLTWGNVSAIDRSSGLVAIKPSGVAYETMTAEDIVVVDLEGNIVDGSGRPSSDTATHLELYRKFTEIGGVVHVHSRYATAWAQALRPLPCYGTTHADYFYGEVPCTRPLSREEIANDYELNTGRVIVETFEKTGINPLAVPAVLVGSHGPFTWGTTPEKAVENAQVLEEVACLASITESVSAEKKSADQYLMDKHYNRKHGKTAYYGQIKTKEIGI
ncbi:MAG: L-ribulose-5-phosphate 4-epimerase [Oscillospiraceae bacterium]